MDRFDRQKEFSGLRPVSGAHRIDLASLEAFMSRAVEGFRGPLEAA